MKCESPWGRVFSAFDRPARTVLFWGNDDWLTVFVLIRWQDPMRCSLHWRTSTYARTMNSARHEQLKSSWQKVLLPRSQWKGIWRVHFFHNLSAFFSLKGNFRWNRLRSAWKKKTRLSIPDGTNFDWQVNVVKGLKLYENVFTDSELSKLTDFVNDLRAAGQNGELSGYLNSFPSSFCGKHRA